MWSNTCTHVLYMDISRNRVYLTALLEYIDLNNKFSQAQQLFLGSWDLCTLYQCAVPYIIAHSFCLATRTELNGVLGSCTKLRGLNFTMGGWGATLTLFHSNIVKLCIEKFIVIGSCQYSRVLQRKMLHRCCISQLYHHKSHGYYLIGFVSKLLCDQCNCKDNIKTHDSMSCSQIQPVQAHNRQMCIL